MAKKSQNENLHKAKDGKKDEFYTQLTDIEKEMKHYKDHFVGKTIYCNCDDPEWSNFFRFFALKFEDLKLKKLISTHFVYSDMFVQGDAYKLEITRQLNLKSDGKLDFSDKEKTKLKRNGDFSSSECVELLKEADIVVTNPTFSLFRQYVAQLVQYDKKFLIIGNVNAITYKEIFKLIKANNLWLGASIHSGDREFGVPDDYPLNAASSRIDEDGNKYIRVKGVRWFTNLDYKERHEDLILFKKYTPEEYPTYDNYDAINVDVTKSIPADYEGVMGVPITFLDKYNPEQFEVVGLGISNSGIEIGVQPYKPEHKKYRKEVQKRGAVDGDLYLITNGIVDVPYARIIIKNKKL